MAETFQAIFQRYTRNQIANTRTTAQGFGRLAEKGSIGAALSFGLLSNQADRAESQQQLLANALQGEQLSLEQRKVSADELRAQSLSNLQNSQASKVDVETGLLPEDSKTINALRLAQTAGVISEAEYQDVQTGILSKYGSAEAQADIIQKLAQVGASNAQARNTNANAAVTEQTGIPVAQQQVVESRGRTFATVANAKTNQQQLAVEAAYKQGVLTNQAYGNQTGRIQAGTQQFVAQTGRVNAGANVANSVSNRVNANANATFTGQRAVGQNLDNQLTFAYGGAERAAGVKATNASATATVSNSQANTKNAGTNLYRADIDKNIRQQQIGTQQFANTTQRTGVEGGLAVDEARLQQNAAFGQFDRKFNVANATFNNELQGRKYDDDRQRRRFEILGAQIGAINTLDGLKGQRELLAKNIDELQGGFDFFGLFRDEEKEQALLDARLLLDRKINLFEQAVR